MTTDEVKQRAAGDRRVVSVFMERIRSFYDVSGVIMSVHAHAVTTSLIVTSILPLCSTGSGATSSTPNLIWRGLPLMC